MFSFRHVRSPFLPKEWDGSTDCVDLLTKGSEDEQYHNKETYAVNAARKVIAGLL